MKKSVELAQTIATLQGEVKALFNAGDVDKLNVKSKELMDLVDEYKTVKAAEDADKDNFITNEVHGGRKMDFKAKNRIFNKVLLKKALTAEEKEYAKTLVAQVGTGVNESSDADGAVLVPVEHYNRVLEMKKQYLPISDLCWRFPAKSLSGTIPTLSNVDGKLVDFDELTELDPSKLSFGKISYKLGLKGDLIPVSNALLQDEDVDVISVIGGAFAKKAVNTENFDIMTLLSEKVDASSDAFDENGVSEGSDYKAINVILNKYLDPAVSANAVIITNQSGFDYLDGIEDKNGRPLLTISLADATQKLYKGRKVVVLSDAELTCPEEGKLPYFIADMEEAVAFVYKEGLEIAVSSEAGFKSYSTLMRAIERYDVAWRNSKAMGYAEITPKVDDGGEG